VHVCVALRYFLVWERVLQERKFHSPLAEILHQSADAIEMRTRIITNVISVVYFSLISVASKMIAPGRSGSWNGRAGCFRHRSFLLEAEDENLGAGAVSPLGGPVVLGLEDSLEPLAFSRTASTSTGVTFFFLTDL